MTEQTANTAYHAQEGRSMAAASEMPPRKAGTFTRRIGATTYRVRVHYSKTRKETVEEKIARLVRGEAQQYGRGMKS